MNYLADACGPKRLLRWQKTAAAVLASTMLLGSYAVELPAIAGAMQVSQSQQGWNALLNVGRITEANQLVLQLDVLDKPLTNYANAVYIVYARRNSQWVQVYTSTGARLISNTAGQLALAPEVIDLQALQNRLGNDIDLSRLELKTVALLRYDLRGGQRDQIVQFERVQTYQQIAQVTTTQLVSTQQTTTQVGTFTPVGTLPGTSVRREQSQFSLAVVQAEKAKGKAKLSNVVARVSLKERRSNGFLQEQFVGDFRYKLNDKKQRTRFVKGLYASDRVVVRLFTPQNQLIGYSEFELLASKTAVSLILPNQAESFGIVRTVYGVDADQDYSIDRNVQVYDYFTQVINVQDYRSTRVTFLNTLQTSRLGFFSFAGLPAPRPTCVYPGSFASGAFALVNQVFQVFSSNLASTLTTFPGQIVQIINVNTNNISTYEVSQQIVNYQDGKTGQGTIVNTSGDDDDDDDDDRKPRKRNCNQGIGNGAEGCDPGNSRPRGGSNDEGGRQPGGRGNKR